MHEHIGETSPKVAPLENEVLYLRATSHIRLRACDHHPSRTLIRGKGGAGPSSLVHTTLQGPTEYAVASNGSYFIASWLIFKNHFLKLGVTQNWDIIAFRTLTTVHLFDSIMCEDRHE